MRYAKWTVLGMLLLAVPNLVVDAASNSKAVGKNPGKIQGRWLQVNDLEALRGYDRVYVGDVVTDIQWKREENEAPIDEELLAENLHDRLLERLREYRVFSEVSTEEPEEGAVGVLRLDCDLDVEPGSRAARYMVGFGAGKSRSILEIHLRDHATGEEVALYHGYGAGSGMGLKLAGGSARKMTQDDIQENTKNLMELLREVR